MASGGREVWLALPDRVQMYAVKAGFETLGGEMDFDERKRSVFSFGEIGRTRNTLTRLARNIRVGPRDHRPALLARALASRSASRGFCLGPCGVRYERAREGHHCDVP